MHPPAQKTMQSISWPLTYHTACLSSMGSSCRSQWKVKGLLGESSQSGAVLLNIGWHKHFACSVLLLASPSLLQDGCSLWWSQSDTEEVPAFYVPFPLLFQTSGHFLFSGFFHLKNLVMRIEVCGTHLDCSWETVNEAQWEGEQGLKRRH